MVEVALDYRDMLAFEVPFVLDLVNGFSTNNFLSLALEEIEEFVPRDPVPLVQKSML